MAEYSIIPNNNALVVYDGRGRKDDVFSFGGVDFERPTNWPASMSWPPRELLDRTKSDNITEEELYLHKRFLTEYADKLNERAERVKKYILKNSPFSEDRHAPRLFKETRLKNPILMKKIKQDTSQPAADRISWALLMELDSNKYSQVKNSTASFGFNTWTTVDGGRLTADKGGIQMDKFTPQAAELLVAEAAARGWGQIKLNGPEESVTNIINLAKSRGLGVDATITYGPFGLLSRKVVIPTADKQDFLGPESEEMSTLATHFANRQGEPDVQNPPEFASPTQRGPMMG